MKKVNRTLVILAIALLIVTFAIPAVTAFANDGMKVIITLDKGEDYKGGDEGTVKVHVFNKGEYVDPDDAPKCALEPEYGGVPENARDIDLEKDATGIYSGTFDIFTSDVDDNDMMSLNTEATYGKTDENDTIYNTDETSEYLSLDKGTTEDEEVSVNFKGVPDAASPGETITITVEVRKGGVLTDAEDLTVEYEFELEGSESKNLPYNKISTGVYELELEIPGTSKESFDVELKAEATIGEDTDWDWEFTRVDLLSVWYHKVTIGKTITKFDIYVCGPDGKAIENAEINFDWMGDKGDGDKESSLTDSEGKATFQLSHDEKTGDIEVEGTVLADGKTQHFEGWIEVQEIDDDDDESWKEEEPYGYGLEVIMSRDSVSGSGSQEIQCIAYLDGQRVSDKEIHYYIYDQERIIAHGTVTTDINGEFTISFSYTKGGDDSLNIDFEIANEEFYSFFGDREDTLDGMEYASTGDWLWVEEDEDEGNPEFDATSVKISVGNMKHGGLTDVTITGLPEDFMPFVIWVPTKVSSWEGLEEWGKDFPWDTWGGDSLMTQNVEVSDGKVTCKIMVPEFLPKTDYTVIAGYLDLEKMDDPNANFDDVFNLNKVTVKPGQSGSSTTGGGTDDSGSSSSNMALILIISGVVLVIIIIVVVLILVTRGKKKGGEKEDEEAEIHQDDGMEPVGDAPPAYHQPPVQGDAGDTPRPPMVPAQQEAPYDEGSSYQSDSTGDW